MLYFWILTVILFALPVGLVMLTGLRRMPGNA